MKYKESYCSHPGRPRLRLRSRSRHTALKFFKCLYLNSHSSQRHQIWNFGTLEGLLRFQENKPLGGARGQNLGHLCNTVLKFFKFLYLDFHSS